MLKQVKSITKVTTGCIYIITQVLEDAATALLGKCIGNQQAVRIGGIGFGIEYPRLVGDVAIKDIEGAIPFQFQWCGNTVLTCGLYGKECILLK